MQTQGCIQSAGFDVERFWRVSDAISRGSDIDSNLADVLKMVQEAEGMPDVTREALVQASIRKTAACEALEEKHNRDSLSCG